MKPLDFFEYPLKCPKCGHEFKAKGSRSQHNLSVPCPRCHVVTDYDTKKLRPPLEAASRTLDKFWKDLDKLGKK